MGQIIINNILLEFYMKRLVLLLTVLFSVIACNDTNAENTVIESTTKQTTSINEEQIVKNIEESMRAQVSSIEKLQGTNLYEVVLNEEIYYATADGNHVIAGQIYRLKKPGIENLTEKRLAERSVEVLNNLDKTDLISFTAENQKKEIFVFTDTSCGYCRVLHKTIPELNKSGITVHYLAFPRSGPNSKTGRELANIWCADDQQQAMTNGKNGVAVPAKSCDNPVEAQYLLGVGMGVRGTPAVFTATGEQIGGYLPVDKMRAKLGL